LGTVVFLAGVAGLFWYAWIGNGFVIRIPFLAAGLTHDKALHRGQGSPPIFIAELSLDIFGRKQIAANRSFILAVPVSIFDIYPLDDESSFEEIFANKSIVPSAEPRDVLISRVSQALASGEIQFQLVLAGAAVKPDTPISVARDAASRYILTWSVYPESNIQWMEGYISPNVYDIKSESYMIRVYLGREYPLEFEIFTPALNVAKSAVAVFLGSLLTLPGIVAFYHSLRDRRRKHGDGDAGKSEPKS
jgi:hypothetical protein